MRSCSSVVMANKYSWRMPWAWKTHQRMGRQRVLLPQFHMQFAKKTNNNNTKTQITPQALYEP